MGQLMKILPLYNDPRSHSVPPPPQKADRRLERICGSIESEVVGNLT